MVQIVSASFNKLSYRHIECPAFPCSHSYSKTFGVMYTKLRCKLNLRSPSQDGGLGSFSGLGQYDPKFNF